MNGTGSYRIERTPVAQDGLHATSRGRRRPVTDSEVSVKLDTKGIFWPVDRPQDRQAGILSFEPVDGGNLELIGSFTDVQDAFKGEVEGMRILGIVGAKHVTLEG